MIDFPNNPIPGVTVFTGGGKNWICSGLDSQGSGIWDVVSGGGSGGALQEAQAQYPYAINFDLPPVTNTFTVVLPRLLVQFGADQVDVPAQNITCLPQRIVDVWVRPDGTYHTENCALTDYWSLPRYDDYLHVVRLQSANTKVQGVYMRRATAPLIKTPLARPFTDYHFKRFHIIPSEYVPWVNGAAVDRGTVYAAPDGNLWMCAKSGVCDIPPPQPIYTEDSNSGFDVTPSGTALFSFRGRSAYAGAWRVSARAGITWYFSHLAVGLLAYRYPAEALAYIKAAAFHLVNNWVSGDFYGVGRKVAGPLTEGNVWEALTSGTATGTIPFPAGAVLGDTCTDGTITWRCIGRFAHSAQKWFWYDADPTMRDAKSPDSHDSYAACYLWCIWKYLNTGGDPAFLDEDSPHIGYTYEELLREVIYANLFTQINAATGNLTRVFQGDGIPFGGFYDASFFMDNCEVWAGLHAAQEIYTKYWPDASYASSLGAFKDAILDGLSALWEEETGTYKYVHGLDTMQPDVPGNALFYPLCMSQPWGWLWGVPLDPDRNYRIWDYMHQHYPYWWARNDTDDLLALGGHYAYLVANPNQHVRRQILERVEMERLSEGQPDLYVMDGAYYLEIRDNLTLKSLTADSASAPVGASGVFDIQMYYPGIPSASALLYRGRLAREVTFPANFTGAYFDASANATASTVFNVLRNDVSVGTCTIAAGTKTATFVTTGGVQVVFAAGDRLTVQAPATPDATLADCAFTFAASR